MEQMSLERKAIENECKVLNFHFVISGKHLRVMFVRKMTLCEYGGGKNNGLQREIFRNKVMS